MTKPLNTNTQKLAYIVMLGLCTIVFLALCTTEHTKPIPENLTVFVVNDPYNPPNEFYSLPHANMLLDKGIPLAKMSLSRACELRIPMAEESKADFSCRHNLITWKLIDYGMWPNYCRWNNKGEWQNSEWPFWLEKTLRSWSPESWR